MKFYMAIDEDFDKMFVAETPEKLMDVVVKFHVEETDVLVSKKVETDYQYVALEWKDQFMGEDESYERAYDYREVEMNSYEFLR